MNRVGSAEQEKMNISPSPFAPENLVFSRDGFSRSLPRQPAHLHAQAESGAYSRGSSRVPLRCPFSYTAICHRVSPEFIRLLITQLLRTDGVHCRESAGTGPVVLKVVPVTSGVAFAGITMDRSM